MTTSHTPGPWTVHPTSNKRNGTSWRNIHAPGHFGNQYVSESLECNAQLIAAAPDLLLALETLLFNALHGNGLDALQQGHDKARAAIEKATSAS